MTDINPTLLLLAAGALALLLLLAPLAIWVHAARCSRALRRMERMMAGLPADRRAAPWEQ